MPGSDWNGGEEKGNREKRKWIAGEGTRKLKERKREQKKKDHNGSQTGGCPAPTYGQAAWLFGRPRPFRSEEVKNE